MTVRKFRDVAEMNQEIWREPGDPELTRAIRRIWEFGSRVVPLRFPPGVHRYRSIEEMSQATEAMRAASFRAWQSERAAAAGAREQESVREQESGGSAGYAGGTGDTDEAEHARSADRDGNTGDAAERPGRGSGKRCGG